MELNTEYKSRALARVRTAAGVRRYKQPIGSIILRDRKLTNMILGDSPWEGWEVVERVDSSDKEPRRTGEYYAVGRDEDSGKWIATDASKADDWTPVVEADSEEELYERLDERLGGAGKKKPTTKPEDAQERARTRQEAINQAILRANVLAEAEELVLNETPTDAFKRMITQLAERTGVTEDEHVRSILDAIDTDDTDNVIKAIAEAASALGLTRIDAGKNRFDPARHQGIAGSHIRPGGAVALVRPGYTMRHGKENVTLFRAVVEAADGKPRDKKKPAVAEPKTPDLAGLKELLADEPDLVARIDQLSYQRVRGLLTDDDFADELIFEGAQQLSDDPERLTTLVNVANSYRKLGEKPKSDPQNLDELLAALRSISDAHSRFAGVGSLYDTIAAWKRSQDEGKLTNAELDNLLQRMVIRHGGVADDKTITPLLHSVIKAVRAAAEAEKSKRGRERTADRIDRAVREGTVSTGRTTRGPKNTRTPTQRFSNAPHEGEIDGPYLLQAEGTDSGYSIHHGGSKNLVGTMVWNDDEKTYDVLLPDGTNVGQASTLPKGKKLLTEEHNSRLTGPEEPEEPEAPEVEAAPELDPIPGVTEVDSDYEGWQQFEDENGYTIYFGQAEEDGRWYTTGPDGWDEIWSEGDTPEEAWEGLRGWYAGDGGDEEPEPEPEPPVKKTRKTPLEKAREELATLEGRLGLARDKRRRNTRSRIQGQEEVRLNGRITDLKRRISQLEQEEREKSAPPAPVVDSIGKELDRLRDNISAGEGIPAEYSARYLQMRSMLDKGDVTRSQAGDIFERYGEELTEQAGSDKKMRRAGQLYTRLGEQLVRSERPLPTGMEDLMNTARERGWIPQYLHGESDGQNTVSLGLLNPTTKEFFRINWATGPFGELNITSGSFTKAGGKTEAIDKSKIFGRVVSALGATDTPDNGERGKAIARVRPYAELLNTAISTDSSASLDELRAALQPHMAGLSKDDRQAVETALKLGSTAEALERIKLYGVGLGVYYSNNAVRLRYGTEEISVGGLTPVKKKPEDVPDAPVTTPEPETTTGTSGEELDRRWRGVRIANAEAKLRALGPAYAPISKRLAEIREQVSDGTLTLVEALKRLKALKDGSNEQIDKALAQVIRELEGPTPKFKDIWGDFFLIETKGLNVEEAKRKGAMIALVPRQEDIDRLYIGKEPKDELHLTLFYLGEADNFTQTERSLIISAMREAMKFQWRRLEGNGFAVNLFNPKGSEPCLVMGVGGEDLEFFHNDIVSRLGGVGSAPGESMIGTSDIPFKYAKQHRPWVPHITLGYYRDGDLPNPAEFADKTGPVVFDRLRVVFAGEETDIPFTMSNEELTRLLHDLVGGKSISGAEQKLVRTPGGRMGDPTSRNLSPRENWVDRAGGLPKYIRMVRNALLREGHSMGKATAMAVSAIKRWAKGGDNVTPKVQAAAAKALAEWEKMKAGKSLLWAHTLAYGGRED